MPGFAVIRQDLTALESGAPKQHGIIFYPHAGAQGLTREEGRQSGMIAAQ